MDDLIERLRAYIAQREKIRDGGITITECNGVPLTLTDLREAADALEAMRKDVERYQWLRQWDVGINYKEYSGYTWYGYANPHPNIGMLSLDAAIDAARKEARNGS